MRIHSENHIWQGRSEPADNSRWHQQIRQTDSIERDSLAIIGFCSDEGVQRNQGRLGASVGPDAIRSSLANLIYTDSMPLLDLGNIHCRKNNLEQAQTELALVVAATLSANSSPIVLGGGHEVAWGSYQGIRAIHPKASIGIINFDAHFDLRPMEIQDKGSSGTPFRQAALWAESHEVDFNYLVLGINPSVNTPSLFEYAREKKVQWLSDIDTNQQTLATSLDLIDAFCQNLDYLYLTICLDVFPGSYAPGVSAPAALGVDPNVILSLLKMIQYNYGNKILMIDIAEMNPAFDIDNRTARLAARLVQEFVANRSLKHP